MTTATTMLLPIGKQPRKSPPSWEVITLVATDYLDPKTVALASCVSKFWNLAMSSQHLWTHLCKVHYPDLIKAKEAATGPPVPYRRLCAIAVSAASRLHKPPLEPRISLNDLLFSVHVKRTKDNSPLLTLLRPCTSLFQQPDQFRFQIETKAVKLELYEELNITWNVFLEGWRGLFTMMDSIYTVREYCRKSQISQQLPLAAGCCTFNCSSKIAVFFDLRTIRKIKGVSDEEIETRQIIVGITRNRLYYDGKGIFLPVDESLRYLEYFLTPNCHDV